MIYVIWAFAVFGFVMAFEKLMSGLSRLEEYLYEKRYQRRARIEALNRLESTVHQACKFLSPYSKGQILVKPALGASPSHLKTIIELTHKELKKALNEIR